MSSLRGVRAAWAAAAASILIALGLQAAPALGQSGAREGIAAVVNDDIVSQADVRARVRLALLGAGVPDNAELRQRMEPQVLRQLIDERLQLQEARRLGVTVSDKEIEEAIGRIAQQNNMSRAQIDRMLSDRGVSSPAFRDQVRASLAWQKVMQRRIRREVVIGSEEVDAELERIQANIGKPEYLANEIFLAVDRPQQEAEALRVAERLVQDIRRGASFTAVARQFSQSAGAANGGDLGWVRQGDLRDELDRALRALGPGQVSPPVRTADGYHILYVRAQRVVGSKRVVEAPAPQPQPPPRPNLERATVNMKQIVFPAASQSEADRKAAQARAEEVRKTIRNCADFQRRAEESGLAESGDMGTLRVKDMPQQLAGLVVSIPVGQPSPVLAGPAGALLLIVCKRDVPMIQPAAPPPAPVAPPSPSDARLPTREEVQSALLAERAEALSRRYLRDLRRAAFVEVRN